jgi:hypothetical protein
MVITKTKNPPHIGCDIFVIQFFEYSQINVFQINVHGCAWLVDNYFVSHHLRS